MATHSITHDNDEDYWTFGSKETWTKVINMVLLDTLQLSIFGRISDINFLAGYLINYLAGYLINYLAGYLISDIFSYCSLYQLLRNRMNYVIALSLINYVEFFCFCNFWSSDQMGFWPNPRNK